MWFCSIFREQFYAKQTDLTTAMAFYYVDHASFYRNAQHIMYSWQKALFAEILKCLKVQKICETTHLCCRPQQQQASHQWCHEQLVDLYEQADLPAAAVGNLVWLVYFASEQPSPFCLFWLCSPVSAALQTNTAHTNQLKTGSVF